MNLTRKLYISVEEFLIRVEMGLVKIVSFFRKSDDVSHKLESFVKTNSPKHKYSKIIICWEMGGFKSILQKNAILANALKLRGYKTHFIISDGTPSACMQWELDQNGKIDEWPLKWISFLESMKAVCRKYSLEYSLSSEFIKKPVKNKFKHLSRVISINKIIGYKYLDIHVGELAWISLTRFMKGIVINLKDLKPEYEDAYREYFYASLVNTEIARNVINKFKPASIYTSHGIYVDYAPPILLASKQKIKAISWTSGYSTLLHYFVIPKNKNKYEVRGITDAEWNMRKNIPLTTAEQKKLTAYIHQRYFNSKATDINIISKPKEKSLLKKRLKIKNENPIVCLFTHLSWEAGLDLHSSVFKDPNEWLIQSIKKMSEIENVNWIIRVHPGEIVNKSLYTASDLIKDNFSKLPKYISILWQDSDINTYGLYNLIDVGVTICGTVGVELPLLGKPIVSAGKAHFGRKGFTIDVKNQKEYFKILEKISSVKPLTPKQVDLAKKYAYSYFVQQQIPINIIDKAQGHWGDVDTNRLEEMLPGKDPALDKICDGIINGKDVLLD